MKNLVAAALLSASFSASADSATHTLDKIQKTCPSCYETAKLLLNQNDMEFNTSNMSKIINGELFIEDYSGLLAISSVCPVCLEAGSSVLKASGEKVTLQNLTKLAKSDDKLSRQYVVELAKRAGVPENTK
jgi:hypothetical protein